MIKIEIKQSQAIADTRFRRVEVHRASVYN
ncbi:Uncharacterised protein [Salmonella enterica subsp. enterica]|uniref:Uncharacterized protein n=1 Tax=Salmonella enterica I TaxID=59201 RepID=A0A379USB2_SALET|nr:Uncharacterised protein [Salmonella enterica subsp. enterica]